MNKFTIGLSIKAERIAGLTHYVVMSENDILETYETIEEAEAKIEQLILLAN